MALMRSVSCRDCTSLAMATGTSPLKLPKWISHTLLGHVVFFEAVFAAPFFIYGLTSNYEQGTLSTAFAFEILIELGALTAIGAVAIWYTITSSLINRTKR